MKYRKADEVLPDALLREVQKYVSGETLYIPRKTRRQKWGEGSGARDYYRQRNDAIREKHRTGVSAEALSREYGLSPETIRKIVYGK